MSINYNNKYLKYKKKYINLKNILGGWEMPNEEELSMCKIDLENLIIECPLYKYYLYPWFYNKHSRKIKNEYFEKYLKKDNFKYKVNKKTNKLKKVNEYNDFYKLYLIESRKKKINKENKKLKSNKKKLISEDHLKKQKENLGKKINKKL